MENNIKLPHGYSVKGGQIVRHWKDKHGEHEEIIANGTFEVIAIRQYVGAPNDSLVTVRFMSTAAKRFQDVQIPIGEITGNGRNLLAFVPSWFVLLGTSPTKRITFLQNSINLQRLEVTDVTKVLRVDTGYTLLRDGRVFYVLGDTILNPPTDMELEILSRFHLRNTIGTPGQGVFWVHRFCKQGSPQAAQFVATLTAFIDPLLKATNNRGRFAVYVVGESGSGKSESAKLLCSIFQEENGSTLSSDKSDIFRMMSDYRDLPFLVDDLNNSGIANATAKKRERLSEIIQQMSGTGVLSIRSETFDVGFTTPIITAEALILSPSTINRTLIIFYDRPFNAEAMSWLQEHQSLYVVFLTGFIEWLCQNHTRLVECVRSWKFTNLNGGRHPNAYVGFHRLMRSFKILKITVELFFLHLREVYAIPQENEKAWRRLLEDGINQATFSDTLEHLRKDSKAQERFYVDAVLDVFENEELLDKDSRLVAKSYRKYVELNRKADTYGRIQRKIFFESDDGDYYCFRGDDLIEYLTAQHDSDYRVSKRAVSAQLDYHGLLQRQGGELSYPIAESGKRRFYHLRRNVVEQLLAERRERNLWLGFDGEGNDDNDGQ